VTTRRGAVGRGLAFVAGLVGVGAAGRELGRAEAAQASTLRFHARPDARPPGRHPSRGERTTLAAELFDAGSGRRVGDLYGAGFALRGPGEPDGPERLELHTFELEDGTIVGSGTAGLGEGTFAVLGGTGRYAGARGTYAVSRPDDGPAEVLVTLLL